MDIAISSMHSMVSVESISIATRPKSEACGGCGTKAKSSIALAQYLRRLPGLVIVQAEALLPMPSMRVLPESLAISSGRGFRRPVRGSRIAHFCAACASVSSTCRTASALGEFARHALDAQLFGG